MLVRYEIRCERFLWDLLGVGTRPKFHEIGILFLKRKWSSNLLMLRMTIPPIAFL